MKKEGLYYTPLGGMNEKWSSGMSDVIESVSYNKETGKNESVIVIKDIGNYDGKNAFGRTDFKAMIPNVLPYLTKRENDPYPTHPKASVLLLSHCHGDHMCIAPLLKAGYKLPTIYADSFTLVILKQSFQKHQIPVHLWPDMEVIYPGKDIYFGDFRIYVTDASHSVPSVGFWFENTHAALFDTGDCGIMPVTSYSTDILELNYLCAKRPDVVMLYDFIEGNVPGFSLTVDEVEELYAQELQHSPNAQLICPISGGNFDHFVMLADLAQKYNKTLVLAGDSYQKSFLEAMDTAGIGLQKRFPSLSIVDGRDKKAIASVQPSDMLVMTNMNFGDGSDLTRALAGNKDVFPLSSSFIVCAKPGILSSEEMKLMAQKGGRFVTIKGAVAHCTAADLSFLFRWIDPAHALPKHCGKMLLPHAKDLIKAEGLSDFGIPTDEWGNGHTYYIHQGNIETVDFKEPQWIGFVASEKEWTSVPVFQKEEDLNAIHQTFDHTFYNRAGNKIKEPRMPKNKMHFKLTTVCKWAYYHYDIRIAENKLKTLAN